jgi:hypothetical protein
MSSERAQLPYALASTPELRNERFPDLGADRCSVLIEVGYTDEEVDALAAAGAVQVSGENGS